MIPAAVPAAGGVLTEILLGVGVLMRDRPTANDTSGFGEQDGTITVPHGHQIPAWFGGWALSFDGNDCVSVGDDDVSISRIESR